MSYKSPRSGLSQRKREVKLLLERVKNILSKYDYSFEVLNYPSSYRERSIDLVAVKDESRLLIRIKLGIKNIHKEEVNDLINAASAINAVPLVLNDEITIDSIVHERDGIYLISDRTLSNIVSCSPDIFLIQRRSDFYIRINSKKLERAKLERGLSLGELALSSGVSRRMMFDYLRNDTNVSLEVAERLIEVLGEDIVEPITIDSLKSGFIKTVPNLTAESDRILDTLKLDKNKTVTYKINKSAPDYIIITKDGCEISFVIEGNIEKVTMRDVVRKILETEKLTKILPSDIKTVVENDVKSFVLDELSACGANLNKILVVGRK